MGDVRSNEMSSTLKKPLWRIAELMQQTHTVYAHVRIEFAMLAKTNRCVGGKYAHIFLFVLIDN